MLGFIALYRQRHGTIDDLVPADPIFTVQFEMVRYRKDSNAEFVYEIRKKDKRELVPNNFANLSLSQRMKSNTFKYLNDVLTIEMLKVISMTRANSIVIKSLYYTPLFAEAFQCANSYLYFYFSRHAWCLATYFIYLKNFQPVF